MSLPRTPFGSVCHLVNGKAFKPTDWSGAGVPIIRIQNLNGPDKPFNYWAGALDKQVLVKTGDLLLAWSGTPGTSFGAHIWSGPGGILNQHIFRCDLHQKAITKEWARIAVNHRLHRLIEQAHGGVGLQHVTRGMVEELEIPLPPLAEQRRIAEVLDRAEALRGKRRAARAQLDSLPHSLFLDLFGNPATNRKGWPHKTLLDLGRVVTGGTPPSAKADMFDGPIPFVTPGDLESDAPVRRSLTQAGAEESRTVRAGATLVCCIGATIGKMGIARVRSAFNQQLNAIEWSSEVDDLYGYAVLRFFKPTIKTWGASTTLPILKKSSFEKIEIPVPPLPLQREFARRFQAAEKLRRAHKESLTAFDELFASLQHSAFRGELGV